MLMLERHKLQRPKRVFGACLSKDLWPHGLMGAKALLRLQGRAGKVLPPSPHHRGARGHALAPPCSTQNWWEALQNAFHFALSQVGLHCVGHALQKGLPMERPESHQDLQGNSIPWGHEQSLRLLLSFPLRGSWGLLLTPGCCFGRGQGSVSTQGGVTLLGTTTPWLSGGVTGGNVLHQGSEVEENTNLGGLGAPPEPHIFWGDSERLAAAIQNGWELG